MRNRVVLLKDSGELKLLANNTNLFLDQIEAMLVETKRPITAAVKGDFSQKISTEGFKGDFYKYVNAMQQPLEAMQGNYDFTERMPSFASLEQPHKQVHDSMIAVMGLMKSVDSEDLSYELVHIREEVLASFRKSEEASASDELFTILNNVREEVA